MLAPRVYLAVSLPLIGIYFAFPAGGTVQSVIYELLDDVKQELGKRLVPEIVEEELGTLNRIVNAFIAGAGSIDQRFVSGS